MRSKLLNTVVLASLFALATRSPLGGQRTASSNDAVRLQGTWSMVSASAGGYPMPADMVTTMKRVAIADTVAITMNGATYFTAIFRLDPAARPRTIDYRMIAGPTTGATQLGIYEFRGDTVWFAFGAPDAARPADFTSKSGDGRTVSAWVPARP